MDHRIMIAGIHGFVGARLARQFPDAVAIDSALLRSPGEALMDQVKACSPDIILNAAAISDIGACQRDPEGSFLANVVLPTVLAQAAAQTGARLISFSSDQVYTGLKESGPYPESLTLPEPANLYARHKLEAEQRVLDIHPEAILLRATWMYDMPMYGHRNRGNFLVNTLEAAIQGRPVRVPGPQHRGITYVRQVASLMAQLFPLPGGVYNYGSENPLTMAQTALTLLDILGAAPNIQDTGTAPHDLWMDCSKLKAQGIGFDTTAQGFARCAADYGLGQQT